MVPTRVCLCKALPESCDARVNSSPHSHTSHLTYLYMAVVMLQVTGMTRPGKKKKKKGGGGGGGGSSAYFHSPLQPAPLPEVGI